MKKKFLVAAVALSSVLALTACGETEADVNETPATTEVATQSNGIINTITESGVNIEDLNKDISNFNPDDYIVSLGDYNEIQLEAKLKEVTDADIDNSIQQLINAAVSKVEVEGRALQTGDIANINYAGKMNGEAFDGGTDDSESGYDLEIGSGAFIPGFEDALIGMEVGETRDIDLTFPDEYYEELAGKPVVFTVTLNSIKEKVYPELTDEFVVGQGFEGVNTVDDLKALAKDMLESQAQSNYDSAINNEIMNKLVGLAEFKNEVPQDRYQYYYTNTYNNDEALATDYGLMLEGFVMGYYGYSTMDQYLAALKDYAEKSVKLDMVVAKILELENQQVTDEDVEAEIEANYAEYGCESVDDFKEQFDAEEFKAYLMNQKVMEIIKNNSLK